MVAQRLVVALAEQVVVVAQELVMDRVVVVVHCVM